MLLIKLISISLYLILNTLLNCIHSQSLNLVSPSNFSDACTSISISGTNLIAFCLDNLGNRKYQTMNFSRCLQNYRGRLTTTRIPNVRSKIIRACNTDGEYLKCLCERTNGSYINCSIRLDKVFSYVNGLIIC